ncbi:phosphotransferase [Streptomyces sp. CB01580]|uniref:phosphotransferase n=1 Tax=Streptomyces sp. CB01580 TaxID=1703933 RepID=UPI0009A10BD1|nr:phosphotransferase [Streptomyces sp. CB01580]
MTAAPGAVCHAAVLDQARTRLLLVRCGGQWALPAVTVDGPWFETGQVAEALRAQTGTDVFLQRCLLGDDNLAPAPERLYAGQALDRPAETADRRWFDLTDLPSLPGAPSDAPRVVRAWIAGDLGGQDWERPDWLDEVTAFLTARLGHDPGRPRQLRTWPRSSVWRVRLLSPLIFKASPAVFADEGTVGDTLARLFPGSFPAVLGHDPDRRWVLMEELAGRPLTDCPLPQWQTALESFAALQIEAVGLRDELLRAGCPDLGISRLRKWTAELLGPAGPVDSGKVAGLSPGEASALMSRSGGFDRAWRRLAAFGVPETLEHGDFRPGHIVVDRDTPRFFDLSDAAVSHPFFSAVTLLDFEPVPGTAQQADDLRASYLRPWAAAYPHADVEAAFEAARPLAVLHAALVRWFRLLPAVTPREKWEFMVL